MRSNPRLKPLPWCMVCNEQAVPRPTKWGERCTCRICGRWSWERRPLADTATHEARKAAHEAFDVLWNHNHRRKVHGLLPGGALKHGLPELISRGEAYRRLQTALGLTPDECHMTVMDAATARRVPEAVERIKARLIAEQQVPA